MSRQGDVNAVCLTGFTVCARTSSAIGAGGCRGDLRAHRCGRGSAGCEKSRRGRGESLGPLVGEDVGAELSVAEAADELETGGDTVETMSKCRKVVASGGYSVAHRAQILDGGAESFELPDADVTGGKVMDVMKHRVNDLEDLTTQF